MGCRQHAEAAVAHLPGSRAAPARCTHDGPASVLQSPIVPKAAQALLLSPMYCQGSALPAKAARAVHPLIWSTDSSSPQAGPGSRSTCTSPTPPSSSLDPAHDGLAARCGHALAGIPSSWRKAGLSSPCGARYSWANSRAWSMAPPRTSSMRRCCCRWNARACLVSRICTPGRGCSR